MFLARLIRRFHDASVSFVTPDYAQWRGLVGAPTSGDVICHNDLGPFNVVFRRGRPTAIIDWDNASPGPRMLDAVGLRFSAILRTFLLTTNPNREGLVVSCEAPVANRRLSAPRQ